MKKNIFYYLLALMMFVCLSGCKEKASEEQTNPTETVIHEHNYIQNYDSRNHFNACTCGDEKDYENHKFAEKVDGISLIEYCTICSYEKKALTLSTFVDGIKFAKNQYYIHSEEGLINFAAIINGTNDEYPKDTFQNTSIKLLCDLDMSSYEWIPIAEEISYTYEEHYHKDNYMEGMLFDGCGYTINNLKASGTSSVGFIGITSSCFTIQNLNFKNANITSTSGNVGVVIGYSSNQVVLKNITVSDSNVGTINSYKVAGLIGMGQLAFGDISILDCSVTNCHFIGQFSVSGLVGELTGTTNCTFTNNVVANCNFKVSGGELKCSPFAVWDANYMSLDRQSNLNYFNSGTNCTNNLNKDNNFNYE